MYRIAPVSQFRSDCIAIGIRHGVGLREGSEDPNHRRSPAPATATNAAQNAAAPPAATVAHTAVVDFSSSSSPALCLRLSVSDWPRRAVHAGVEEGPRAALSVLPYLPACHAPRAWHCGSSPPARRPVRTRYSAAVSAPAAAPLALLHHRAAILRAVELVIGQLRVDMALRTPPVDNADTFVVVLGKCAFTRNTIALGLVHEFQPGSAWNSLTKQATIAESSPKPSSATDVAAFGSPPVAHRPSPRAPPAPTPPPPPPPPSPLASSSSLSPSSCVDQGTALAVPVTCVDCS